MRRVPVLLIATALAASRIDAQQGAAVELEGPSGQRRSVTAAELSSMPRRKVDATAHAVHGRFAGVPLVALLRLVGAPAGDSLRGAALASYVLVEAADGYRALFALAELDSAFTDRVVLLVDRKDGAALGERDGPFQVIAPGEKRPARWGRQVRRIRVVRVPAGERP